MAVNRQIEYWLALQRLPGVGPVKGLALYESFGDLAELFKQSRSELQALDLTEEAITCIKNPDWASIAVELQWAEQAGQTIISRQDPLYPSQLKEIHAAPLVLYVQGDPALLHTPQLAIIGSRNPTQGGLETALQFAHYLANTGWIITSGLALGIDGASHRGALSAVGKTIAVMGTGLNQCYPAQHQALREQILCQGGALVSEFSLDTQPKAENFPRRNRMISGLSRGVLVVEAAIRSGSLITAHYAMEQGREVFAIPGSIHNPLARGCHVLLKQGAKLVETAQDIIEELGGLPHRDIEQAKDVVVTAELSLDTEYQRLLSCINYESTPIDLIIACSGLTANVVSSMLLILELQGMVFVVPGGYSRTI